MTASSSLTVARGSPQQVSAGAPSGVGAAGAHRERMRSARQVLLMAAGAFGLMLVTAAAWAANNNGVALQGAYNLINDIVGGFGKQLLTVLGFAVAALGYMATNATSIVMKFVGFAIFLGVGLAAAVGVVGALI